MDILNKETKVSVKTFLNKLQKGTTIIGIGYNSELYPYKLLTEPYIEVELTDDGFLKVYNKVFVPKDKVTEFNNFSIVLESSMLGYTTKLKGETKNLFDSMTTYKEGNSVLQYAISSVFEEPVIYKSSFTINKKKFTVYRLEETQITSLDFGEFTHTLCIITTEDKEFNISKLLQGNLSKTETHHVLNMFSGTKALPETINAVSSTKNGVSFNMFDLNGFILVRNNDLYELGSSNNNLSFHKNLIKGSKVSDNSLNIMLKNNHDITLYW